MTLNEIATKAKNKTNFKFRKIGTHIALAFEASGHIYHIDGKRYDVDQSALLASYEIICDHPFSSWSMISKEETGKRLCLDCDRTIDLCAKDAVPCVPERISPVKLNKQEQEKEEFLMKIVMKRPSIPQPFIEPRQVNA